MHKETVNTFTKGMVKDTHPLTTPADVLTDCLNGTIITYNGNEMILQNDMGNVKIGSAALPEGYIPVGITEYGGIIYVASYNPETNKGLIGSFPSPLLVQQSQIWSVNNAASATITKSFNSASSFYDGNDIIATEVKINIGLKIDGDYIIHTGDKIEIDGFSSNILNTDHLKFQFAVLKSDGSLEVVSDLEYLNGAPHIYTGKSSGIPMIIVRLLTLNSFSLQRTYSKCTVNNSEGVKITFTGKFEEEEAGANSHPCLGYLNMSLGGDSTMQNSGSSSHYVDVTMGSTIKYDFIPILDQGNLISMKKSVVIDTSKFKKDTYELTGWSYKIMDSYIKINWNFDYYTLDSTKELIEINFKFIPIEELLVTDGSPEGTVVSIEKESYNGSFEEIINFGTGIEKNRIYLVEILGKEASLPLGIHIANRFVYTTGIFNDYYGIVRDFTNKGFKEDLPEVMWNPGKDSLSNDNWENAFRKNITIEVKPEIQVTNDSTQNNITILKPNNEVTLASKQNINSGTFVVQSSDRGSGYYEITVRNRYNFIVNLSAEVKYKQDIYGEVASETLLKLLESYTGSKLIFTDESQHLGTIGVTNSIPSTLLEFLNNTTGLYHKIQGLSFLSYGLNILDNPQLGQENPLEEAPSTGILLESTIKAKASSVKSEVVDRVGLAPLYHSNMDVSTRDKAFSCWNPQNLRLVSGTDDEDICYNSTLAGSDVIDGTSADAGSDDTGLNTALKLMDYPMVSIFAAVGGDHASYAPDGHIRDYTTNLPFNPLSGQYRGVLCRRNVAGWYCSDDEIDGGDNFLMTVWKQSNNSNYRFTVLASHKELKTTGRLPRLDYMLRCLLSLLFTKLAYSYSLKYITTDPEEYGCYNPIIAVDVDLLVNDSIDFNNVALPNTALLTTNYDLLSVGLPIYHYILKYKNSGSNLNGITDDEVMLVKYDIVPEILSAKKVFTLDSYIEEITNLLNGTAFNKNLLRNDRSNARWIYVPDWGAIANANNVYRRCSDGSIEWLVDDMTPYLKLSGTPDGSGYVYLDEEGNRKISRNGSNFGDDDESYNIDPLSTASGSPGSRDISIINDPNAEPIGDVLRTWDFVPWPFYHSFQHMFKTLCEWRDKDVEAGELNEIVVNMDSGHAGAENPIVGLWVKRLDEDGPDISSCLGNSYNSIYGRLNDSSTSSD